MPTPITMPSIGANVEAAMLARWCVKEGQRVRPGDVIAEIESEKATLELEADREGIVARLLVAEGSEQIGVGQVIAVLTSDGESLPEDLVRADDVGTSSSGSSAAESEAPPESRSGKNSAGSKSKDRRRHVKASPVARRLARERRIDLPTLTGSGPGGRIVKADVERATESMAAVDPRTPTGAACVPDTHPRGAPYDTVPLSSMRRTIARRLTESKATVPHFYLSVDVRLDALLMLRAELNDVAPMRISVTDMLIKALATALVQTPDANVQFAADSLYRFRRADISVAVAVPEGLVTPVVRDAGARSPLSIAAEMRELAQRARRGELVPHDYQGGTATLSNLGMYGVGHFDAVINPPQALIVAVGAAEKRAVVNGDAVEIATMITATGSIDHRAIDGATAAQFMTAFKQALEQPARLVLQADAAAYRS